MSQTYQYFLISLFFVSPLAAVDVVPIDQPDAHQQVIQVPPPPTNNPLLAAPNNPPSDESIIDMSQIPTFAQIRADLSERWWYERWAYHYLNCTACLCVQFGGLIETLSVVCTFVGLVVTGVLGISTLEQSVRSPLIVISTTLTAFCVIAPRLATAFFKISTQRENLAEDYARYGRADPRHLQPITISPTLQQNTVATEPATNPPQN